MEITRFSRSEMIEPPSNGHIFATCRDQYGKIEYVCVKCKLVIHEIKSGRKHRRVPSSIPLNSCNEEIIREII